MRVGSAILFPLVSLAIALAGPARAQSTWRVSVDSSGGEGNSSSTECSISADGRYVAFRSEASDLVPDDSNGVMDVFVHDRLRRETTIVSVGPGGQRANSFSYAPAISADGRYVAFVSIASNLVSGDANGTSDVIVHDRLTGESSLASVDSSGLQGSAGGAPAISADGRYVTFTSNAPNLVPGDTNGTFDVFVHDRQSGETSRVSVSSAGIGGDRISREPSISADGRYVAFSSEARNLVPADTNGAWDVFVHDRATGETSRVSVNSSGVQANGDCLRLSISGDGNLVAFDSNASNLDPSDTSRFEDVYVHDRRTGETSCVSVDSAGVAVNFSYSPAFSGDGRYVAFASDAGGLVLGDSNASRDIFVHDLMTGVTSRASVDSAGVEGNRHSDNPAISANGRCVAFTSEAETLVPNDGNRSRDAFVHVRTDCGAGNVNVGAGEPTDVLFVNDSAGGPERIVRLATYEPLQVFVAPPPSATAVTRFALYAWSVPATPAAASFDLPFDIGETCLPMPLTGGSPAPRIVWNNTGSALLGAPTRPSSPAPSIVARLPRGLGRPASGYLQGIIVDRGAPNGRAAVTNGVTIEIR